MNQRFKRASLLLAAIAALVGLSIGLEWMLGSDDAAETDTGFIAAYNQKVALIPESDRAWPLYIEAGRLIRPIPKELVVPFDQPDLRPGDPAWPQIADYLRAHAEGVAKLRQAALLPSTGCVLSDQPDPLHTQMLSEAAGQPAPATIAPPSPNLWAMDIVIPQLDEFRLDIRVLQADARLAATEGDGQRFVSDFAAILRIARHTDEAPFIGARLQFFVEADVAMDLALHQLAQNPRIFTDDHLVKLRQSIDEIRNEHWDIDLSGERASIDDINRRLYGKGIAPTRAGLAEIERRLNKTTTPGSLRRSKVANRFQADKVVNDWMEAARDDAAKHLWERGYSSSDQLYARTAVHAPDRYPSLQFNGCSVTGILTTRDLARMERDAALAAIALERHRRLHGGFPAALAEIAPHLLSSPPLDEYSGHPLIYRTSGSGVWLYSVGPDGDDDGGRPFPNRSRLSGAPLKPPPDGDTVFLAPPGPTE